MNSFTMLKSIKISGYKLIKERPLDLKNLAKVNYFIGKNGSGKSSIIELIMMVFNAQYWNQDDAKINEAFGDTDVVFSSDFAFEYSYESDKVEELVKIGLKPGLFKSGKAVLQKFSGNHLSDIGHYFDLSNSRKTIPHKELLTLDLDTLPAFINREDLKGFFILKSHAKNMKMDVPKNFWWTS
ncbi:TPA: hypothetical protein DGH83_00045 [Candidatus Peregrinibacteria bacterium]|nr:hypothetical protein [Candidatus Peregrinibacteria bacterium]